jgi:hypothetical protein
MENEGLLSVNIQPSVWKWKDSNDEESMLIDCIGI